MINLPSIIALLQIALSLLLSSVGTATYPQAQELAQQAINIATQALSEDNIQNQAIGSIPTQTTAKVDMSTTTNEMTRLKRTASTIQTTIPEYSLDFYQPVAERYVIKPGYEDDPAYLSAINPGWSKDGFRNPETGQGEIVPVVYLELIIKDRDGKPVNNALVEVVATDSVQNTRIDLRANTGKGNEVAGNITKEKRTGIISVKYPFRYFLKTLGQHTITFKVGTLTKSINLYRD